MARVQQTPAAPSRLTGSGGVLVTIHGLLPLVVAGIAERHAPCQHSVSAAGTRRPGLPLALFEYRVIAHAVNQLVVPHHCFVVVRSQKDRADIHNPASSGAVHVDNDCRVAFLAFVLPTRVESGKLPCEVDAVHTCYKSWQPKLAENLLFPLNRGDFIKPHPRLTNDVLLPISHAEPLQKLLVKFMQCGRSDAEFVG